MSNGPNLVNRVVKSEIADCTVTRKLHHSPWSSASCCVLSVLGAHFIYAEGDGATCRLALLLWCFDLHERGDARAPIMPSARHPWLACGGIAESVAGCS